MKPKKRQKLCYNCEGDIDLDVIVCPYCAADLREEALPENLASENVSHNMEQMSDSLYPVPHSLHDEEDLLNHNESRETQEESASSESLLSVMAPILLISTGSILCLLALFLALFSQNGELVLKWDARFWFLYLLASLPFLIFGYRALHHS